MKFIRCPKIFNYLGKTLKKMNSVINILINLAFIQIANAVYTTDLCNQVSQDCVGNSNDLNLKCQPSQCNQMPYIQKCGQNKCAKNEEACEEYTLTSRYFNSRLLKTNYQMFSFPFKYQESLQNSERNFKKFDKGIKNCPIKELSTDWRSDYVCMRRKKCYMLLNFKSSKSKQIHIKTECPCDGRYKYKCGKDYCTANKSVCHKINLVSQHNNTLLGSINKCSFWNI